MGAKIIKTDWTIDLNLCGLGLSNSFLGKIPKVQATNKKLDEQSNTKIKNTYALNTKKWKDNSWNGKNFFNIKF